MNGVTPGATRPAGAGLADTSILTMRLEVPLLVAGGHVVENQWARKASTAADKPRLTYTEPTLELIETSASYGYSFASPNVLVDADGLWHWWGEDLDEGQMWHATSATGAAGTWSAPAWCTLDGEAVDRFGEVRCLADTPAADVASYVVIRSRGGETEILTSDDGTAWTTQELVLYPCTSDTHNSIEWVPIHNEWIIVMRPKLAYLEQWPYIDAVDSGVRAIGVMRSRTLLSGWSRPRVPFGGVADTLDAAHSHAYGMLYACSPWAQPDGSCLLTIHPYSLSSHYVLAQPGASADAVRSIWRPHERPDICEVDGAGLLFVGRPFAAVGQWIAPVISWDGLHNVSYPTRTPTLYLARWTEGQMVGMTAPATAQYGVVVTREIELTGWPGGHLDVSVSCPSAGTWILVRVYDETRRTVLGVSYYTQPVGVWHRIEWSGGFDLSSLAGTRIRLEFTLYSAATADVTLYRIRATETLDAEQELSALAPVWISAEDGLPSYPEGWSGGQTLVRSDVVAELVGGAGSWPSGSAGDIVIHRDEARREVITVATEIGDTQADWIEAATAAGLDVEGDGSVLTIRGDAANGDGRIRIASADTGLETVTGLTVDDVAVTGCVQSRRPVISIPDEGEYLVPASSLDGATKLDVVLVAHVPHPQTSTSPYVVASPMLWIRRLGTGAYELRLQTTGSTVSKWSTSGTDYRDNYVHVHHVRFDSGDLVWTIDGVDVTTSPTAAPAGAVETSSDTVSVGAVYNHGSTAEMDLHRFGWIVGLSATDSARLLDCLTDKFGIFVADVGDTP